MHVCLEFGEWLRRARENAGLSLRQLARLAGVNRSYLARLEHGKHAAPSRVMAARLAGALRVPTSEGLMSAGYLPEGLPLRTSLLARGAHDSDGHQEHTEANHKCPSQTDAHQNARNSR